MSNSLERVWQNKKSVGIIFKGSSHFDTTPTCALALRPCTGKTMFGPTP